MPGKSYSLIQLRQANRYAGYQFWGRMRMDDLQGEDVFNYLVLSVYEWIVGKVPADYKEVDELQVPAPTDYATVSKNAYKPYHTNIGFDLDITPIPDERIWSLRLRETDHGTKERKAVIGRLFTTRVGVRLNSKGETELAVKIDVTDPAEEAKELEFAFRPGFVRTLGEQENVHFEQVSELKYGKAFRVNTDEEYKKLLYMLDSADNQLPLAVFTYAHPGEMRDAVKVNMEELIKKGGLDSILKPTGMAKYGLGMPGLDRIPDAAPAKKKEEPVLPYNADEYCASDTFAFALTYVLGDKYTERFRNRIKKDFKSGDILLCGAKKFRGGITVFSYPGENTADRKKTYDEAVLAARMYPKHKSPYDYGETVFEAEARDMDRQIRVKRLISDNEIKGKEEIEELREEIAKLFKAMEKQDKRIKELEGEKNEAFDRGLAAGKDENDSLRDTITELRRTLASKDATIGHMQNSFRQEEQKLETLEKIKTIDTWPEDNEGIVNFFLAAYGDRIDFTERGISTASKCDIKPEKVWDILYRVAVPMVDLFRNNPSSPSEKDIAEAAGFDMSYREGSETREREEFMRYRKDKYQGNEILFEPHLKFRAGKSEADYQRLHFCYDTEMRRIVISYLGDHLPSYSTRYAK